MREPESFRQGVTTEEYFALEASSQDKHELWWGEVVAMAGALPDHVTVAANALRALANRLDDTPCQAGVSDLRVAINEAEN